MEGDPVMAFDIRAIRHPKERIHGNATLVAGAALWALFWFELVGEEDPLVAILALSSICLLLWGFSAAGNALTRAYMFGNYVLVGPEQFPHIDRMVKEGAQRLGMSEAPPDLRLQFKRCDQRHGSATDREGALHLADFRLDRHRQRIAAALCHRP